MSDATDDPHAAVAAYLTGEFPGYVVTVRTEGTEAVFTLDKGDMRHVLRIAGATLAGLDGGAVRRLLEERKVAERLLEFGAMPVRLGL